jgi:hypothetical protein
MNSSDSLLEIFNHQRELMEKFHRIELKNRVELSRNSVLSQAALESVHGQLRIKEYAWRVTEEIGEALAEFDLKRYEEEVADALHFLIEMYILVGITPQDFQRLPDKDPLTCAYSLARDLDGHIDTQIKNSWELWAYFIKDLAGAMNLLKNRPWKTTFFKLDQVLFKEKMIACFYSFIRACGSMISQSTLYETYLAKAKVNYDRIRDGV